MSYTLAFVTNRTNAPTRRETVAGTEYLVVPVVALVAGVVNGELVTTDQLIPEDWNGVPVPLGHPQANGEYVSARSPELEAQAPARFYRARLENNSLKGEIWINLAQAQAIGGEAAEAVKRFEAGQMVNVSTGYFRDLEPTSGTFNSKAYTGIARNLRPDQLAILLNEDGACNLNDGCGAPRVNAKEGLLKVNVELSLDERMSRVYDAWYNRFAGPDGTTSVYVREVFEEFVIAKAEEGGLWAYPYTVNEAEAIGFGQPFEVVIAYQDKESGVQVNNWLSKIAEKLGIKSNESEVTVNEKDKLIAALVANTRCKFKEEELKKFDEGQLKTLSDSMAEPTPAPEPAPPAPPTPEPTPAPAPVPAADVTTLTQMVSELTKTVQELSGKMQTNADQEKTQIIAALVANQTTFTAEELGKMDLQILRKMQLQFVPADYGPRGLPIVNVGGGGDWVEYEIVTPSQNGGTN